MLLHVPGSVIFLIGGTHMGTLISFLFIIVGLLFTIFFTLDEDHAAAIIAGLMTLNYIVFFVLIRRSGGKHPEDYPED
jgi:hypothetical protein